MDDAARRKKLTFRAWRRGFREMDLLMGSFADAHMASMTDEDLFEFERLLATPDWDVGSPGLPPSFQEFTGIL